MLNVNVDSYSHLVLSCDFPMQTQIWKQMMDHYKTKNKKVFFFAVIAQNSAHKSSHW